jgi:outer membrane protein OmpA-like peptidoglycan-associated protein
MVGLGVNPALITADWRGETAPAVATGDGVKEPLNRRATIGVN